ncbi:MAG: trypsin-like peptidase domain-containing protein [Acidimicrobiia bacterium]|nr:trypsin-like peptidase domain-containing protein [Acidimicrobiia bacterium]
MVVTALLALTAGAGGWMVGASGASSGGDGGAGPDSQPVVQSGDVAAPPSAEADEPVAAVAAHVAPSVVMVGAGAGVGSGVVYDDGLVLTNAHVVGRATSVELVFADGATGAGDVLGTDPATDIAVVAITSGDAPPARIARDAAQVGQLAVALGSPFGLDQTVTAGVVSAVDRPLDATGGALVPMLQTDAPINPGNSGGPLADRNGAVIGINTLIISRGGESNGIGFAVPIGVALDTAERIITGESLERGRLGVVTEPTVDGTPGAMVSEVQPGSPAAAAGLQRGDVIAGLDGAPVRNGAELAARIQRGRPGETVEIEVRRGGGTALVTVALAAAA